MEFWVSVLPILVLLALGYGVGSWRERRHLADLDRREAALFGRIARNNLKRITHPEQITQAALVMGEVVIASDYFKTFAAHLRNLIGGEVKSFDTLMLRARREAVLRMLESASALGATEVWNLRLGTCSISGMQPKNPAVCVEVFAFGTAVVRG